MESFVSRKSGIILIVLPPTPPPQDIAPFLHVLVVVLLAVLLMKYERLTVPPTLLLLSLAVVRGRTHAAVTLGRVTTPQSDDHIFLVRTDLPKM